MYWVVAERLTLTYCSCPFLLYKDLTLHLGNAITCACVKKVSKPGDPPMTRLERPISVSLTMCTFNANDMSMIVLTLYTERGWHIGWHVDSVLCCVCLCVPLPCSKVQSQPRPPLKPCLLFNVQGGREESGEGRWGENSGGWALRLDCRVCGYGEGVQWVCVVIYSDMPHCYGSGQHVAGHWTITFLFIGHFTDFEVML